MRGLFLLFMKVLFLSSQWSPNGQAATAEEALTMHDEQGVSVIEGVDVIPVLSS